MAVGKSSRPFDASRQSKSAAASILRVEDRPRIGLGALLSIEEPLGPLANAPKGARCALALLEAPVAPCVPSTIWLFKSAISFCSNSMSVDNPSAHCCSLCKYLKVLLTAMQMILQQVSRDASGVFDSHKIPLFGLLAENFRVALSRDMGTSSTACLCEPDTRCAAVRSLRMSHRSISFRAVDKTRGATGVRCTDSLHKSNS